MTNIIKAEPVNISILQDEDYDQASKIFKVLDNYVKRYLKPKTDYGKIPGCGNKPVLFKPGAEKFCRLFKLRPTFEIVDRIVDYEKDLFHYHYRCTLYRFGEMVGQCDGLANSKENKFNRKLLTCPKCGSTESVMKDKNRDSYYCWTKKGGCGANNLSKKSVSSGDTVFDYNSVNTIIKMAQKRSLVGAVLVTCSASEYFTQDFDSY